MHSYTFTESVQKLGESIERFNMDSRAGHCDGFQAPFFPINPFPDLGYEEPPRGLLLWPVIHSMQNSPTPSLSTSPSLTSIGGERRSSSPSTLTVFRVPGAYQHWYKIVRYKDKEQKILIQLWAENFEQLETQMRAKFGRRFAAKSTIAQECMKKIKYLIDHYKETKDWNLKQE